MPLCGSNYSVPYQTTVWYTERSTCVQSANCVSSQNQCISCDVRQSCIVTLHMWKGEGWLFHLCNASAYHVAYNAAYRRANTISGAMRCWADPDGHVVIPDSWTSVPDKAFYGCKNMTSLTLGKNVQTIGYYSFYACTGLQSIHFSDSLTSIGAYAFYKCSALESLSLPTTVTTLDIGSSNSALLEFSDNSSRKHRNCHMPSLIAPAWLRWSFQRVSKLSRMGLQELYRPRNDQSSEHTNDYP